MENFYSPLITNNIKLLYIDGLEPFLSFSMHIFEINNTLRLAIRYNDKLFESYYIKNFFNKMQAVIKDIALSYMKI